jgi:hypothetical protein
MTRHTTLFALLLLCLSFAVPATAEDLKSDPGYVDLEWITIPPDADEIQDIELGAVLLGIAASQEHEDPALIKALNMIKSVRVKSWSMDDEDAVATAAVEKVTAMLEKGQWKRLIYFKDDEETVTVSTQYGPDGGMVGIMLVTYEPGDSVAFVNVVGDLDLGTMFKLAKEFDEESLEAMLEELEQVEGIEVNRDGN